MRITITNWQRHLEYEIMYRKNGARFKKTLQRKYACVNKILAQSNYRDLIFKNHNKHICKPTTTLKK